MTTKINFDLKLSTLFSGTIVYIKQEYFNNETRNGELQYDLVFKEGKLKHIFVSYFDWEGNWDMKWVDPVRWNETFWIKAPEYCHFDDSSWKRKRIIFQPNKLISSTNYMDGNLSVEMVV